MRAGFRKCEEGAAEKGGGEGAGLCTRLDVDKMVEVGRGEKGVEVCCGGVGAEGEGGASDRAIGGEVRRGERRDMPEVVSDRGS